METEEVYLEVDQRVTQCNDLVLARALENKEHTCPDCEYPQNALLFDLYLKKYTRAIVRLHHLEKTANRYLWRKDSTRERFSLTEEKYVYEKKLKPLRPCSECVRKYNPTNRRKYKPRNIPVKGKRLDILDVFESHFSTSI